MNLLRSIFVGSGLVFGLGIGCVAGAAESYEHTPAMFQSALSRDQAVAMVQSRYGARVVRADTIQEDGRVIYSIRLTSQDRSRVWTVRIDAATGREM